MTDARRTLIAGELGPLHRDAAAIRIGSALERIELRALETRLPLVQALPNGEILIVDKLCERHDDESHDLNASIYSSNGSLVRRFLVGDGIREVQTTPDGRIWISYTDEGIFGTDGWHHGPVGAAGLLRWATDGTLEWEYAPPPGLDWMADCEALNVADDATWACYYDGFPLVRIAPDDTITVWPTPIRGADAIATGGGWVTFYGGYHDDRSRCVSFRLNDGRLTDETAVQLLTPDGRPFAGQVTGRGRFLHAFDGPRWFRLDTREVHG